MRSSLGLHLEGAVVIIDEAHNLVDAINAAHTKVASAAQLTCAYAAVVAYRERFCGRLAAGARLAWLFALQCRSVCVPLTYSSQGDVHVP